MNEMYRNNILAVVLGDVQRQEQVASAIKFMREAGQTPSDEMVAIAKGVSTTTTLADGFLESVTPAIVDTLATDRSPDVNVPHKAFPSVDAKQITHSVPRLIGRGNYGRESYVAEGGRSLTVRPEIDRITQTLKLHAFSSQVTLTAMSSALVDGGDAEAIADDNAREAFLADTSQQFWNSDTRQTKDGASGLKIKGVIQQIEEGTASTSLISSLIEGPGHVYDMRGEDWGLGPVRTSILQTLAQNLQANTLFAGPSAFTSFEKLLDPAVRINMGSTQPILWNTYMAGMSVAGQPVSFVRDRSLSPYLRQRTYEELVARRQATTLPAPGVTSVAAQTDNSSGDTVTSRFDANSRGAGTVSYYYTQTIGGVESNGVRHHASTYITVAAGQEVKHVLTCDPGAECINVYRDVTGDTGGDHFLIFRVAGSSTGTVTFYDNNIYRPNTEVVIATYMPPGLMSHMTTQDGYRSMLNGQMDTSSLSTSIRADKSDNPGIVWAKLGAKYMRAEYGRNTLSSTERAICSIFVPIVVDPNKCMVIRNIVPGTL